MSPVGAIFVPSPSETETKLLLPAPLQSLNGSRSQYNICCYVEFKLYVEDIERYVIIISIIL